jgi:hypothetical protein
MELAHPASLYQLDGVLDSCSPVKAMPEGFTDQRVGRCMVATLTSMDLCEELESVSRALVDFGD